MILTGNDDDDTAAHWAIRLDAEDGIDEAERAALETWLAADSRRAGALLRAEAALAYIDRGRALVAVPRDVRPDRRRFLHWSVAGGAAVAAGIAGFIVFGNRGREYATATGEIRRVPLADGSVAALNTKSKVVVAIEPHRRQVELVEGEAWFQVAHDSARPFEVEAGKVRVRAVGTAFSVRRHDDGTEILVTEGVVEAWLAGGTDSPIRIAAGERGFVGSPANAGSTPQASAIRTASAPEAIERALAWRSGELVLNGEDLGTAAVEMNRYNMVQLKVAPALGRQPLVGYFRINDPQRFAQTAAALVGGHVTRDGDLIIIEPF